MHVKTPGKISTGSSNSAESLLTDSWQAKYILIKKVLSSKQFHKIRTDPSGILSCIFISFFLFMKSQHTWIAKFPIPPDPPRTRTLWENKQYWYFECFTKLSIVFKPLYFVVKSCKICFFLYNHPSWPGISLGYFHWKQKENKNKTASCQTQIGNFKGRVGSLKPKGL